MSTLFNRRHPHLVFIEGDGAGAEGGGTSEAEASEASGSTYTPPATQADLDRIIESRLARDREKYRGFDEFKSDAEKWRQMEDEKKTPSEKAIEEATQRVAGETAAKYERRIATTEIKALAASAGFLDPADAVLVVLGDGDIPKKDDDLDVDELKQRVEKLAQDKPYLVKEPSRTPRTRPQPRPGDRQEDTAKSGKSKAAAALRQLGAKRLQ